MRDMFGPHAKMLICICTPIPFIRNAEGKLIHDTISPLWHRARVQLSHGTNTNMMEMVIDGLEVGDARSKAAANCIKHEKNPEFLFFLDYDVLPAFDVLTKLMYRARCYPDHDIFAGVYCCKHQNPPDPLIYRENGQGAFWDWKVGDLLTTEQHGIKSVHMGLTLIRISLFQKMLKEGVVHGDGCDQDDEPFFHTTQTQRENSPTGGMIARGGTEDIYFCNKAVQMGAKIMVDTSCLAGHHDKHTGIVYGLPWDDGPYGKTLWLSDEQGKPKDENLGDWDAPCDCLRNPPAHIDSEAVPDPDWKEVIREEPDWNKSAGETKKVKYLCNVKCELCKGTGTFRRPIKKAIDIGAGEGRRLWPGFRTFTTDVRADSKPDYVQDTRWLNLPDNHFDLVASRHHLEHIGRWEQERVWSEMFRILKPGGQMNHIVPNIEWAMLKVNEKKDLQDAFNVLYGAQEAQGFDKQWNVHYFGYTPDVARALAEGCGLVDVEVVDWHTEPECLFEIVIRGRKPMPEVEAKEEPIKQKILTVCQGGNVRSVSAATILKSRGHEAIPVGHFHASDDTLSKMIGWADKVLILSEDAVTKAPFMDNNVQGKIAQLDIGPDKWGDPFSPELVDILKHSVDRWASDGFPSGKLHYLSENGSQISGNGDSVKVSTNTAS